MRWPKLPWDTLEEWGISLQVAKTALAAAFAWALAGWLLHTARPYFASLAAILSVQATIAESVSRGIQRIFGVMGGIMLAILFTHWLGLHAWSLALLVFIAMALATRLHLGSQGIPQVAISALMVWAVGSQVRGYAWYRALETALGSVVAAGVSALLWPPDFTPDAVESLRLLAVGLADVIRGMAEDLRHGLEPDEANRHLKSARAIDAGLARARRAMKRAETSLRWNPWHRGARGRLQQLGHAIGVLDHSVIQVRGIARTLFVTLDRDVSQPSGALPLVLGRGLADVLEVMAEALTSYAYLIQAQDQHAAVRLEELLREAHAMRHQLIQKAGRLLAEDGGRFLDVAAVLVDLDKMSQDLVVSARLIIPIVRIIS